MHEHHEHHGHEHSHAIQSKEETFATLGYMLKHNQHHTEELRELAHNLEHLDYTQAAEELKRCAESYDKGNEQLAAVLESLNK